MYKLHGQTGISTTIRRAAFREVSASQQQGRQSRPLKLLQHHGNIVTRSLTGTHYAGRQEPLRRLKNKIPVWPGGENVFILL